MRAADTGAGKEAGRDKGRGPLGMEALTIKKTAVVEKCGVGLDHLTPARPPPPLPHCPTPPSYSKKRNFQQQTQ